MRQPSACHLGDLACHARLKKGTYQKGKRRDYSQSGSSLTSCGEKFDVLIMIVRRANHGGVVVYLYICSQLLDLSEVYGKVH